MELSTLKPNDGLLTSAELLPVWICIIYICMLYISIYIYVILYHTYIHTLPCFGSNIASQQLPLVCRPLQCAADFFEAKKDDLLQRGVCIPRWPVP